MSHPYTTQKQKKAKLCIMYYRPASPNHYSSVQNN